ncbi:hypothetical protein, partial [[Clostridium] symbiosum]|uniref:hypothetical protein n=1 Tax=Clostridium symbiosum TaxID=1512 RepID=UPI0025A49597
NFLRYGDLTEARRTRPERTMSGVARGDCLRLPSPWEVGRGGGNPAGMNCLGDRLHSLEAEGKIKSEDAA